MNCCVECFNDTHIRNTIEQRGTIGNCDFCSSKGVPVYDIAASPNPLADMIISLVQSYSVSDAADAKLLKTALHDDWNIFTAGGETVQALTMKLCSSAYRADADIFLKRSLSRNSMTKIFSGSLEWSEGRAGASFLIQ